MRTVPGSEEGLLPTMAFTLLGFFMVGAADVGQFGTPRADEGTRIFMATEHPNYSGRFRLTGQQTRLVGSMQDRAP